MCLIKDLLPWTVLYNRLCRIFRTAGHEIVDLKADSVVQPRARVVRLNDQGTF